MLPNLGWLMAQLRDCSFKSPSARPTAPERSKVSSRAYPPPEEALHPFQETPTSPSLWRLSPILSGRKTFQVNHTRPLSSPWQDSDDAQQLPLQWNVFAAFVLPFISIQIRPSIVPSELYTYVRASLAFSFWLCDILLESPPFNPAIVAKCYEYPGITKFFKALMVWSRLLRRVDNSAQSTECTVAKRDSVSIMQE